MFQTTSDELQLAHVLIVVFAKHVCMCNYSMNSTLHICWTLPLPLSLSNFEYSTLIFKL
jgi:NADH:ubiquinone oxidoreductase subunit H